MAGKFIMLVSNLKISIQCYTKYSNIVLKIDIFKSDHCNLNVFP